MGGRGGKRPPNRGYPMVLKFLVPPGHSIGKLVWKTTEYTTFCTVGGTGNLVSIPVSRPGSVIMLERKSAPPTGKVASLP